MLHPVGSHSPAVYWRRRLVLLASVVLLIVLTVLTVRAVFSSSSGAKNAANSPSPTSDAASQPSPSAASSSSTGSSTTRTTPSTPATSGSSTTAGSTAPPAACTAAQLKVAAVVGKPQYSVGDEPILALQVTNSGPSACVQNVADSQIVLTVFNGASRVWGSHDCMIAPGTDERTLVVGQPAEFSVQWTGLTSQPSCAGTRQRVGAGSYTLYATLAGEQGSAAQFSIS